MVERIKATRKSDLVIKIALVGNAVLTFMFAFNYLPELFDVFGLLARGGPNVLLVRVVAGLFAVAFFDGAYYAWGEVRNREGLSKEQIATADTAKQWSLYGSLAASAGQFVLSQSAADLGEDIVFGVSLMAMVSVAAIALLHMYWFDKFQNESFEAVERAAIAQDQAEKTERERLRQQELRLLEEQRQAHEHDLRLQQLRAEMALEGERQESETAVRLELLRQEMEHEKAVARQTAELLKEAVNRSAMDIARAKAARLKEKFLVDQGMDPGEYGNGHPT